MPVKGPIPEHILQLVRPKEGKPIDLGLGEGYEAYITREWYNPLIRRRELEITIVHIGRSTPSRIQVRLGVAKALGVDVKRVYVRKLNTEYGLGRTRAEVHVYDTPERALQFEPKHIIERNKLPEEEGGQG